MKVHISRYSRLRRRTLDNGPLRVDVELSYRYRSRKKTSLLDKTEIPRRRVSRLFSCPATRSKGERQWSHWTWSKTNGIACSTREGNQWSEVVDKSSAIAIRLSPSCIQHSHLQLRCIIHRRTLQAFPMRCFLSFVSVYIDVCRQLECFFCPVFSRNGIQSIEGHSGLVRLQIFTEPSRSSALRATVQSDSKFCLILKCPPVRAPCSKEGVRLHSTACFSSKKEQKDRQS